jgi:hypothetical protein
MNERSSSSCACMACIAKARRGRQMSCGHGALVDRVVRELQGSSGGHG